MTNREELRQQALMWALQHHDGVPTSAEAVIATAEKFFEFLVTVKVPK